MDGSNIRRVFSSNVKIFRTRAGLSQLSLAMSLGLAPNFISDIECGKKWVSPETLGKLSQALNVEPNQFFQKEQGLPSDTNVIFNAYADDLARSITESIDKVKERYRTS